MKDREELSDTICSGFGSSKYGQLGVPNALLLPSPTILKVPEQVLAVWAGDGHSLLLTESLKLYSLGRNAFGQLGIGSTESVHDPIHISTFQGKRIEAASCGAEHSMAITSDGEVYAWGLNIKGQLGLGDCENRTLPTLVAHVSQSISSQSSTKLQRREKPYALACGALHSLVVTDRNRLFACGYGGNFALGFGTQADSYTFEHVKSLEGYGKVDKVSAGVSNSAAILQGNLYFWGKIMSYIYEQPVQISLEHRARSVRGKSNSPRSGMVEDVFLGDNCCLSICKGELWAWGIGPALNSDEPCRIQCPGELRSVSAGQFHGVCVGRDYKLYVWGKASLGQLAELNDCEMPTALPSYDNAAPYQVACGRLHTIVLSYKEPETITCQISSETGSCVHLGQIEDLQKELAELRAKLQEEEKAKRRQKHAYLENNPAKFARTPKLVTPSFEIPFEELTLESQPFGKGGYGFVYRARWRGSIVAVKKMRVEGDMPVDRYQEFLNECQTMTAVRHPNIVTFLGACTKQPNLCIVLEYCHNHSLWDVLRDSERKLPYYMRYKIALDTARGVNYLHKFPTPVLHRDLKSLNLLLDEAFNTKIADFGWTRFKADAMTNKIGTYQWMAPEVIASQRYTEKADVFSFGIIMWELASRLPPYQDMNGWQVAQEVAKNGLRPPEPADCPKPFYNLMQRCWHPDPEKRPDFDRIILELEEMIRHRSARV
jgi:mitogen-activated protein kinase kinase kinase 9